MRRTTQDWVESGAQFQAGVTTNAALSGDEGIRLAGSEAQYAPSGEYLSQVQDAEFPFTNAVLSWNADAPDGTALRFDLRVRDASGWSNWYEMGEWSSQGGRSISGQADSRGKVDVDTLKLNSPATALQYRVEMTSNTARSSPLLREVSVVYADLSAGPTGPEIASPAGSARDLPVPQYSQLLQDPAVATQICSPTSLAMVMQYWGSKKSVSEVVSGVKDRTTGIFGDWALNAAFAGANEFDARVDRFYSMAQLEQEIAAGRPVIISITYSGGELSGAPSYALPQGHLIVVRGFTPQGDVIVNDPAAPTNNSVRRVYEREQLERVWLRSGGIAYLLSPRGGALQTR